MPRREGQEEKEDRQSEITSEHLVYLFRNLLTGNGLYNQAIHPHVLMKQLPTPQPLVIRKVHCLWVFFVDSYSSLFLSTSLVASLSRELKLSLC